MSTSPAIDADPTTKPRVVGEQLKPLFDKLAELTPFSSAARRVVALAGDSSSDFGELVEALQREPTLALGVLRLVNSSAFGLAYRVADLTSAISLLGVGRIRNLAMAAITSRRFRRNGHGNSPIEAALLWRHVTTVAEISKMVAKTSGVADPDEAYVAGLLHDIGLAIENQFLTKQLRGVVDQTGVDGDWCASERDQLGFDHAQLGAYVVQRCGLPERTINAIDHHHDPLNQISGDRGLTYVVCFANYLAYRAGVPSIQGRRCPPPHESVFTALGIGHRELDAFRLAMPELSGRAAAMATV